NNNIDAVAVWEPAFTQAQEAVSGSKVLAYDTDTQIYKDFQSQTAPDVVVIRRDFVENEPEAARNLIDTVLKATDWVNAKEEEAAEITADKYFKLSVEDTLEGIRTFTDYGHEAPDNRPTNVAGVMGAASEWLVTLGVLDETPDVMQWH